MVRLQENFDAQVGLPKATTTLKEAARRKAAQKEMDAQLKVLLGEQRYRQLEAQS